jgi:hypothetical protein
MQNEAEGAHETEVPCTEPSALDQTPFVSVKTLPPKSVAMQKDDVEHDISVSGLPLGSIDA